MKMMKYKGYEGRVAYDAEAKVFHGEVVGLKDVITFQGTSVREIENAFHDSVDDYLEWCKERGEQPEKAFSGKLNLRIPPSLHAELSRKANAAGISLNDLIISHLQSDK